MAKYHSGLTAKPLKLILNSINILIGLKSKFKTISGFKDNGLLVILIIYKTK
jgi:hypothetical protein